MKKKNILQTVFRVLILLWALILSILCIPKNYKEEYDNALAQNVEIQNQYNATIENKDSQIVNLENQINNLSNLINQKQALLVEKQNALDSAILNGELQAEEIEQKKLEISNLQSDINILQTEKNNLESQINYLTIELNSANTRIEEFKSLHYS